MGSAGASVVEASEGSTLGVGFYRAMVFTKCQGCPYATELPPLPGEGGSLGRAGHMEAGRSYPAPVLLGVE